LNSALPRRPVLWGDLHNHNLAGTALGSMERSIAIARSNLDFFAFTGQSQWHDMAEHDNGYLDHWRQGFARHADQWEANKKLLNEADQPGEFTTFLGYEWHSSRHGDYNIIFPDEHGDFRVHNTLDDLVDWARQTGAILIPHHLGYPTGGRGANWDTFPAEVSPVVEIFSEHGGCERDEGPFPYIRHGLGPRMTGNSYQGALARGFRVGAVAGTDNHIGVPGAYAEGLTAIIAERNDRASIMAALRERRCYAVSGDRIGLDFSINGEPMGSVIDAGPRAIHVRVCGWDRIRSVEVLRNNTVIHRHTPTATSTGNRVKIRLEFGWGPWSDLNAARICDWDGELAVTDGRITDVCPCFVAGPFDESRRSVLRHVDDHSCSFTSYTQRQGAFEQRPDAIAIEVEPTDHTKLHLRLTQPRTMELTVPLDDLAQRHHAAFTDGFQSEAVYFHRTVPQSEYETEFSLTDPGDRDWDVYYVRATQDNGQMAWSSPIWVHNND
jgi:hypothetical protein